MNNKNINSGDFSTNMQARQIVVNNNFSEDRVRSIAIEVFKENIPKLSAIAQEKLYKRADEITTRIINSAIDIDESMLNNFQDPGVQLSLFEVQKGYSRTGDNDLLGILTNLFIDRLRQNNSSLNSIVTDEAIKVAPKLTLSQMNVLSFIYRLNYIRNKGLERYEDVLWFVENKLLPISDPIPSNNLQFKHLAYTGVVLFSNGIRSGKGLTGEIFEMYNGALQKGYTKSDIPEDLLEGCLKVSVDTDNNGLRFIGQSLKIVQRELVKLGYDHGYASEIRNFLYTTLMSPQELGKRLREDLPKYETAFSNWDKIDFQNISLSTVGATLAETYLIVKKIESKGIINEELIEG